MLRGARGAIQVDRNDAEVIKESAEKLMRALIDANQIEKSNVSAVIFTLTPDLNAAFPAAVRNRIHWELVPFLCSQEIAVTGAMERVIRVLVLFETDLSQEKIRHQYLGTAEKLRPDLKK
jgi:chorismate mutase